MNWTVYGSLQRSLSQIHVKLQGVAHIQAGFAPSSERFPGRNNRKRRADALPALALPLRPTEGQEAPRAELRCPGGASGRSPSSHSTSDGDFVESLLTTSCLWSNRWKELDDPDDTHPYPGANRLIAGVSQTEAEHECAARDHFNEQQTGSF